MRSILLIAGTNRSSASFQISKATNLVANILAIVDREKPLHLSLVGGDPLVRYREVEVLLPQLEKRGIHTQVVTSAFRIIPPEWNRLSRLNIVVSIDGLQAAHDERRKPATYERILKNIAGVKFTIHSTITGNIAARPGYLEEFLKFWSSRPEINKVWFSLLTPQRGAVSQEILTPEQRLFVIADLLRLRVKYPILDVDESLVREMLAPPSAAPSDSRAVGRIDPGDLLSFAPLYDTLKAYRFLPKWDSELRMLQDAAREAGAKRR